MYKYHTHKLYLLSLKNNLHKQPVRWIMRNLRKSLIMDIYRRKLFNSSCSYVSCLGSNQQQSYFII